MAIEISGERKKALIDAIQAHFRTERDEDIGELQASILLDFVMTEIAPAVYNQAIRDAQAVVQRTVSDLDLTLFEPEPGR